LRIQMQFIKANQNQNPGKGHMQAGNPNKSRGWGRNWDKEPGTKTT